LSNLEESKPPMTSDELLKTVRLIDEDVDVGSDHCESLAPEPTVVVASTSSPLPSPLLCPRRTFLALLILASKFSQDKCYSNRAWAKLSGLPAREIGRCERTLGQLSIGASGLARKQGQLLHLLDLVPLYGPRARVVSVSSRR
jgi:hypothetical protein